MWSSNNTTNYSVIRNLYRNWFSYLLHNPTIGGKDTPKQSLNAPKPHVLKQFSGHFFSLSLFFLTTCPVLKQAKIFTNMSESTTYFITGINRGIGHELVKQLLTSNPLNRVIGTIRRDIHDVADTQITKNPRLTILKLDFENTDSYISLATELTRLDVGIDVFISNAAINTAKDKVLDTSPEEFSKFLKINTVGPVELLKILKPFMLRKTTRKVVLTSSILGSIGSFPKSLSRAYPCASYSLSKAALNIIGVELSYELAEEGFIVVNYHPGLINTRQKLEKNADISMSKGFEPDEEFLEYVKCNTLSVEEGVKKELEVIHGLKPEDSGKFLTFDGREVGY